MKQQPTVATYLKSRLEQLGIDHLFGVAGNYTAPFLNTILQDASTPLRIIHNVNELCAGYAADGYARLKGGAALHVTYSVGAFSLLNAIAGSYTEEVPLILINGAPTNKEDSVERNAGLMYAHTTGDMVPDIDVFRSLTVAAERITNARQAPYQIDSVLTAMLTYKRPVYIEVTEDVWRAPCILPQGELSSGMGAIITRSETGDAVAATLAMLSTVNKLIFWAGIELQRYGLQDDFLQLLDSINKKHVSDKADAIHFISSPLSKSVISERHPYFEGCVTLTQQEVQKLVGDDGCVIGLGAWTTGKDTGNQNIRTSHTILAAHNGIWVGAVYYPQVGLADYITQLNAALQASASFTTIADTTRKLKGLRLQSRKLLLQRSVHQSTELDYDSFFNTLQSWITEQHTLVVDAGFPLVGAQGVKVPAQNGFVAQASWLAIGYSVAAATGVKYAQPEQRVVVVVGDGAFHETCQAVADHHAAGQNNVVFILVNGIYGIEQEIVNPNVFRNPPDTYPDPQLDTVYPYNILPAWQYSRITETFGGQGRKVATINELQAVLAEITADTASNFVVEVTVPQKATPAAITGVLNTTVGEDEIQNPAWPPVNIF